MSLYIPSSGVGQVLHLVVAVFSRIARLFGGE